MILSSKYKLISAQKKKLYSLYFLQHLVVITMCFCAPVSFGFVYAQESGIHGLIVSIPPSSSKKLSTSPGSASSSLGASGSIPVASSRETNKQSIQSDPEMRSEYTMKMYERQKHGVAVLINDEPITHHEIDQRTRFISMNSKRLRTQAQDRFKALIKRKSTTQKLRRILNKVIEAHPEKSRDQVLAIFDTRKQSFAKQLQQQALSSARASLFPAQQKRAQKELIEERLQMQEAKRLNLLASPKEVNRAIAGVAERNELPLKQFLANLKKSGVDAQTFKDKIKAQLSWGRVLRRRFSRTISISMAEVEQQIAKSSKNVNTSLRVQKITL